MIYGLWHCWWVTKERQTIIITSIIMVASTNPSSPPWCRHEPLCRTDSLTQSLRWLSFYMPDMLIRPQREDHRHHKQSQTQRQLRMVHQTDRQTDNQILWFTIISINDVETEMKQQRNINRATLWFNTSCQKLIENRCCCKRMVRHRGWGALL